MRTLGLIYIFWLIFTMTVAADVIPAVQRSAAEIHIDTSQSANSFLEKRQFCDAFCPYICSAIDGDAMCMAKNEVCCQRIVIDGTLPYVCDSTHPYCYPSDNGVLQCESDDTCSGGGFRRVDATIYQVGQLSKVIIQSSGAQEQE